MESSFLPPSAPLQPTVARTELRVPEATGEESPWRPARVRARVCPCVCVCAYACERVPVCCRLATRARQVQARRLPIGRGILLRPRHPLPTTVAGWDPLRRVQACAALPSLPSPSPAARAPASTLPPPPPPRHRRALPNSGSGRAGASPGARSPVAVALVTPALGRSGEPGEGARGGTGGGGEGRLPRTLPSRSLALSPARLLARSLAQRRQQRSRTDAG